MRKEDRLAPYSASEEFAAGNTDVTLEPFEGHHFTLYSPPASDWASQRQADFLLEVFAER
jgi:hypothetical protein